jgi:hypothetical protein
MSTCKTCADIADVFATNVKNWGYDAATTRMPDSIRKHTGCEYVDCYCQHTIEKAEYVRDK